MSLTVTIPDATREALNLEPSDAFPGTDVDLFAQELVPFGELMARARPAPLAPLVVPIASIPDLVRMKRDAGRPQDFADIAALEAIAKEIEENERRW